MAVVIDEKDGSRRKRDFICVGGTLAKDRRDRDLGIIINCWKIALSLVNLYDSYREFI